MKEHWIQGGVFICPFEHITANHKVLFITTPSTPKEVEAASYNSDPLHILHKNERADGQVGQVQFVKEAAGKLRVFAMVDV